MGIKNTKTFNLNDLRKGAQAGDLVLISTHVDLGSDISLNPALIHEMRFFVQNNFCRSSEKAIPVWDSAAIIVESSLQDNPSKYLLELTHDGFVLSEVSYIQFLGRFAEFKRKNYKVGVRMMSGIRDLEFRRRVKEVCDKLAGQTLDEFSGRDVYAILETVENADYLISQSRKIFRELRSVFDNHAEGGILNVSNLDEVLREITGVKITKDHKALAKELNLGERITFEALSNAWANGRGKQIMMQEQYKPSNLNGEFLYYFYKTVGVIKPISEERVTPYTPDDFSTSPDRLMAFRNSSLELNSAFTFFPQQMINL